MVRTTRSIMLWCPPLLLAGCLMSKLEVAGDVPGGSSGAGGSQQGNAGSSVVPKAGDSSSGGSSLNGGGATVLGAGGEQAGGSDFGGEAAGVGGGTGGSDLGGHGGDGTSGSAQGGNGGGGGSSPDLYSGPFKILVLEKTLGFRHDSIPLCESLLTELGKTADGMMPPGTKPGSQFTVTIANDNLSEFTDAGLASYALVFSCSPTGNVFSDPASPNGTVGMAALQKFVEGGQAWAGVHAALDFEKTGGFPWYTDTLTGAYMASHDADGVGWNVTVPGAFASHPVVSGVPNPWSAADEWYNLSKDIETLPGFTIVQKLPDNRAVTWVKDVSKGRMFYTERGHNKTVYAEAPFKRLLLNGVLWATRRLN